MKIICGKERKKEIIRINYAPSPDLSVFMIMLFMRHASEEIASGKCTGLSYLQHKI